MATLAQHQCALAASPCRAVRNTGAVSEQRFLLANSCSSRRRPSGAWRRAHAVPAPSSRGRLVAGPCSWGTLALGQLMSMGSS